MSLCQVCSAIPFERLFGSARVPRQYDIGDLGHARANRGWCSLCNFWSEAYELAYKPSTGDGGRTRDHRSLKLRLQICAPSDDEAQETEQPWFERAGIWAWAEDTQTGPCMWLRFCSSRPISDEPQDPLICVSCVPARDDARLAAKLMPRIRDQEEIDARRLNYAEIQEWLRRCSRTHGTLCGRSTAFKRRTLDLRLINVETRLIEHINDDDPYLALSYVWGSTQRENSLQFWRNRMNDGDKISLPEVLPRTIEDALTLTGNLGIKYLWVDAFCIDQSDDHEVHRQLAHMHLVFECAFLVVAAMDSTHADAGIHGVSRDLEKMTQPTISVPYGTLMATYVMDVWQQQGRSPWEQRAWTLQELLLAKRIVLLYGEITIMRCQQAIFCGLLEADDHYHAAEFEQCRSHFWENGFDVDLNQSKWSFGNFDNFLANYTRRQLTQPGDILDACLGALTQITQNTGVGFVQGLPRADFQLGLLWKPHHKQILTRREGFPSWTWAGWMGRIEHHYCIDDLAVYDDEGAAKRQEYLDNGGQRLSNLALEYLDTGLEAYIPHLDDGAAVLHVSSRLANVVVKCVRTRGKGLRNLPRDSQQPRTAVGDHWVIVDRMGRPLANRVGEVMRFEDTDYSFQVNPELSAELRRRGGRCELVYLRCFPYLRDNNGSSSNDNWLFNQVGCLVVLRDGAQDARSMRATRIGAVFLGLDDWLELQPYGGIVALV